MSVNIAKINDSTKKPKNPDLDFVNIKVDTNKIDKKIYKKDFLVFSFDSKVKAQVTGVRATIQAASQFGWPNVAKTRSFTS
ncbi:hypothetical protein HYS03_00360 [Candidatus Woesebacteria bacterium]|nr:hypothetical protein [Candidatus Woesebacteria bacterium]